MSVILKSTETSIKFLNKAFKLKFQNSKNVKNSFIVINKRTNSNTSLKLFIQTTLDAPLKFKYPLLISDGIFFTTLYSSEL